MPPEFFFHLQYNFSPSGWKSRDSVPKLVDSYMDGKVMVDEFVTFTKPLAEINEAFDLMHQGKALRTVVNM